MPHTCCARRLICPVAFLLLQWLHPLPVLFLPGHHHGQRGSTLGHAGGPVDWAGLHTDASSSPHGHIQGEAATAAASSINGPVQPTSVDSTSSRQCL